HQLHPTLHHLVLEPIHNVAWERFVLHPIGPPPKLLGGLLLPKDPHSRHLGTGPLIGQETENSAFVVKQSSMRAVDVTIHFGWLELSSKGLSTSQWNDLVDGLSDEQCAAVTM